MTMAVDILVVDYVHTGRVRLLPGFLNTRTGK